MKKKGIQVAFAITLVLISIIATFWKSELLGNIIYAVVIPSFLLSIISFVAEIAEMCEGNAKKGSTLAEENADLANNLAEELAENHEKENFYCPYAAEQTLKEIEEQYKKSIEQYKAACAYKDVRIFFLRCKSVCQSISVVGYVLLFLSLILSPYAVKLISALDLNCITLWSLTILYFTLELKSEICAKIFDILYKKGLKTINRKVKNREKKNGK